MKAWRTYLLLFLLLCQPLWGYLLWERGRKLVELAALTAGGFVAHNQNIVKLSDIATKTADVLTQHRDHMEQYENKLRTLESCIVYPGPPAEVDPNIGKPMAVLTIDFGEMPRNFGEGQFYVLKVLKIRGTKIDWGFCPVERKAFYGPSK